MGETVAEAGWMGQDERRGALRTGRGGPDPPGGHGDTAGCLAAQYKSWVHLHLLEEVEGGVKMTDEVRYLMPFGPFGKLARLLFVKRALARIFQYRRQRIDEIFPR